MLFRSKSPSKSHSHPQRGCSGPDIKTARIATFYWASLNYVSNIVYYETVLALRTCAYRCQNHMGSIPPTLPVYSLPLDRQTGWYSNSLWSSQHRRCTSPWIPVFNNTQEFQPTPLCWFFLGVTKLKSTQCSEIITHLCCRCPDGLSLPSLCTHMYPQSQHGRS